MQGIRGVEKQRTFWMEKMGSLQEVCRDLRAVLAFLNEIGWMKYTVMLRTIAQTWG